MEFTERYIQTFYDNLEKGKLVGQRCKSCGSYQLFPMPACRHCQSTDLEYKEFSKKGKLLLIAVSPYASPRFMASGLFPLAFGAVQVEEGPMLYCPVIEGIDVRNVKQEFGRLPLAVDITTHEIAGNWIPVAVVRED
jgi:uncharacterized OB-fold protein